MTEIKINFANTKVAKFYDEMNSHLNEIESATKITTTENSPEGAETTLTPEQSAPVEEFLTTDQ
jgi:hypothetical protein